MVSRSRELEFSFGNKEKVVEENEKETVVLQRRCIRAAVSLKSGDIITRQKLSVLRPAPKEAIMPYEIEKIIGKEIRKNAVAGEAITWEMFR